MPLTGIRVIDLTRLLPGPYMTRLLAELGADVIKVEDPNGGDYARWAPPICGDPPNSSLFAELNAGKRGIVLDLKKKEAQAALRKLALGADVLVDSFRPGVLGRMGLDPRELMAANERLIYCAMSGFGLTGPDRDRAGHDIGYLGRSGAIALSGDDERPFVAGYQVADIGASFIALSGVMAALMERAKTGKGSVVDVALSEAGLAFNVAAFGMWHGGEAMRRGHGILDGSRPCYALYETKDKRWLAVGALEPKFWTTFVHAIGLPELEYDGLDTGDRGKETRAKVQARLHEKTRDEWTALFRTAEACVEPVLEIDEVETDEHHRARHIRHDSGLIRSPIRVSPWTEVGAPSRREPRRAPTLGEHTEEVLREAGLTDAEREALLPPKEA